MVTVPPRHYCTVANPVSRDAEGSVLLDVTGQVRLRHADLEIRLAQDPFPLYPGEVLEKVSDPLYLSCHLLLGLHTAFRREDKLGPCEGVGGNVSWFLPRVEWIHCSSTDLPQAPAYSSHAYNRLTHPSFESCRPVSPPNQPGSGARSKLPASQALSDLCQA